MKLFIKHYQRILERNILGEETQVSDDYYVCRRKFWIFTEYLNVSTEWRKSINEFGKTFCKWGRERDYVTYFCERDARDLLATIIQYPNKFILS